MKTNTRNTIISGLAALTIGLSGCGDNNSKEGKQEVYDKQGNSIGYIEKAEIQKNEFPKWIQGKYLVGKLASQGDENNFKEIERKSFRIYNNEHFLDGRVEKAWTEESHYMARNDIGWNKILDIENKYNQFEITLENSSKGTGNKFIIKEYFKKTNNNEYLVEIRMNDKLLGAIKLEEKQMPPEIRESIKAYEIEIKEKFIK